MSRYGFSQRASSGSRYNRTWALHMISCTVNANGCALTQLCKNQKLTECVLNLTQQNFLHNPFFSLGLYLHAYRVLGGF